MKQYFSFQWHITDECDQRCKHCYIFADGHPELLSMSWEQIQAVLENSMNFCERYDRLPYFYITGGDPILHSDFWRLAETLKERDIPFTIMGNPFHVTQDVCERLKDCGCQKYQMSLDGLRDTHDWFRKPGSFDCTLDKISIIKAAGILSVIMTTVSGANIIEIPALIDTVAQYGVDIFAFARYCGSSLSNDDISPRDYRDFLEVCDEKSKQYANTETYFNRKDHLWTLFEHERGEFVIPDNADEYTIYDGCNCGNCHIAILPSGDIYACRRLESKVGNVFQDELAYVWQNPIMNSYRDYGAFKKCGKCELLRFCRGCPAVAYGKTGDFYAADPQCWKEVAV
ncbi:MAG: radical SAM/SPASM domain protein, ACGX system [Clostridiales bacterium]|jgi:radical SAM/SPASM domain protein of ACGX system|nr:radical SAM/SPASM domain protein, ACGX system [Clostridiales bacterium]